MYYVFLETKDNDLFSRIAQKDCPLIVEKLIKDYRDFVKQNCGLPNDELRQKYLGDEGRNINFINCYLLLGSYCAKPECCTSHITVLISDQLEIFSRIMQYSFKAATQTLCSEGNDDEKKLERVGIQTMRQAYQQIDKLGVEKIEIPNKYSRKHKKYWALYIRQAKKYAKTEGTQGFFYIRADTDSDYEHFKTDTGFSDLINPCDTIRTVV
jgi:hypothetical protein